MHETPPPRHTTKGKNLEYGRSSKWLVRSRLLPGLGYSVHFTGARWEGGEAEVDGGGRSQGDLLPR